MAECILKLNDDLMVVGSSLRKRIITKKKTHSTGIVLMFSSSWVTRKCTGYNLNIKHINLRATCKIPVIT